MVLIKEERVWKLVIPRCPLIAPQCLTPFLRSQRWNSFIDEVRIKIHELRVVASWVEHAGEVERLIVLSTSDTAA